MVPKLRYRAKFNKSKRILHTIIKWIREYISLFIQSNSNNIRVIASLSIPICESERTHFRKCFKSEASYEICSSKKETYFEFKFHALTIINGFLADYVITSSNIYEKRSMRFILINIFLFR